MQKKSDDLSKDFPHKLKQLRLNRGWSQEQLGRKIGIERNRISRYARGALWPTLELLVRMANIFEVSLDYLIRDTENMAINRISNKALLERVEKANNLPEDDQTILVAILDAFIKKHRFEEVAQS